MPDQNKTISHDWRRFLLLSVQGLIVLVLVIGAGMGWLARSAPIQLGAVAAIENADGKVSSDWEWIDGNLVRRRVPPVWRRETFSQRDPGLGFLAMKMISLPSQETHGEDGSS